MYPLAKSSMQLPPQEEHVIEDETTNISTDPKELLLYSIIIINIVFNVKHYKLIFSYKRP